MEFRILGPLEVIADDGECRISAAKLRVVLAFLVLRANQSVTPDALMAAVWGDAPPASAAATLQTYVYQLRKQLGAATIETQPGGYALIVPRGTVDALRFEDVVRSVSAATGAAAEPGVVAARLTEALGWWRGAALADFDGADWARADATRLDVLRVDAQERLIDARLELGEHVAVAPELEALIDRHPLRERFYAQLMLAYYRSARQADALRVYARLRTTLRDELGVEPSRELAALEVAVLSQAPELDAPERPGAPTPAPSIAPAPPSAMPSSTVTTSGCRRASAIIRGSGGSTRTS